jgi:AcrR family transcriptional regulator
VALANSRRAAHRPSRRVTVVEAAMALAAERPYDDVTVSDIAERAGMTPAAIYYHFPSKEDVLLEGLRAFSDELIEECRQRLSGALTVENLSALPADLLGWFDRHRNAAAVFFVASAGLNLAVESWRREFRNEMVRQVALAVAQARGRISPARAGVIAAAYLSLLENAARSWLSNDEIFRKLGSRRIRTETVTTARRILSA